MCGYLKWHTATDRNGFELLKILLYKLPDYDCYGVAEQLDNESKELDTLLTLTCVNGCTVRAEYPS